MTATQTDDLDRPRLGVAFIVLGMAVISWQDMLIKQLSGDYPLHQIVFARSMIGIAFTLLIVWYEGGIKILKTKTPGLHLLRALLIVVANMTYFSALAVMPMAEATALFFVAPLFITLLSIPILGETVGPRRWAAVLVGFAGVLVMLWPDIRASWFPEEGAAATGSGRSLLVSLLPIVAALAYALMQMMTRRLRVAAQASAMAIYIQGTFIIVGAGFFAFAGDGRHAVGVENESLQFLLRAWTWPTESDWYLFVGCGVASGFIAYSLAQAYRLAAAAIVAPFEYIALPLAVMWGWAVWGELPGPWSAAGILLIMGSGIYVFVRERVRDRAVSSKRPLRRW